MRLSVLIVNWNTRDLLIQCIGHLKELRLPRYTEIIVVDNGSTDGSAEAVRSMHPDVRLLVNPHNFGFAKANNRALNACRGRFILLLNSDCYPCEQSIQRLIHSMETDSEVGIAGGALLHPNGKLQNSFGVAPTLATELLPKGILQTLLPRRYPSKRRAPREPLEVEAVLGAFFLVRREAWLSVGGLDEGYFVFLEETDWCLRMRRQGWRVIHVPHATAVHLLGRSAAKDPSRSRVEFYLSRYRFFSIHRGRLARKVLYAGIFSRALLNWITSGVMCRLASSDRQRWDIRHGVDRTLVRWHLKGCPDSWGLTGRCLPNRVLGVSSVQKSRLNHRWS